MKQAQFAVLGCGFWSQFQIEGWKQLKEAKLVALYNRTRSKAEKLARKFDVPQVYDSPEELFEKEKLDFVDIITDVNTHERFVLMAAKYGLPVICQKPMAPNYETAAKMVKTCADADVPFMIHENFRWQPPIRALKKKLESGVIGKPFRARITHCHSFPVFGNQPFLAELEQFAITDVGSHVLDVARFLFGEAKSLYCQTATVHKRIKGEDVASVSLKMKSRLHCNVEISFASKLEHERFPETYCLIEGEKGSIELAPDYWLRTTTKSGTHSVRVHPLDYNWTDPRYRHAVVHHAIIATNQDLLRGIVGEKAAETTGQDNLKTMELVFASYQSAKTNSVVEID